MPWIRPRVWPQWCRMVLLSAGALIADGLVAPASAAGDLPRPPALLGEASNVVMGVGLVIGLPGTGDASVDQAFVGKTIVGVLKRAGLDLWAEQIQPGRIAKVIITAELPSGPIDGKRVPVSVTAIGDATSLAGGTLLATPLCDQDGRVYAISQGRVEIGNQVAGAELSQQPGTAARIGRLADGAVLDHDHPQPLAFD